MQLVLNFSITVKCTCVCQMVRIIIDFQFTNYSLCLTPWMSRTCNMVPEGRYSIRRACCWTMIFLKKKKKLKVKSQGPWSMPPCLTHGTVFGDMNSDIWSSVLHTKLTCLPTLQFSSTPNIRLLWCTVTPFNHKNMSFRTIQLHFLKTNMSFRSIWLDFKNYKHQ